MNCLYGAFGWAICVAFVVALVLSFAHKAPYQLKMAIFLIGSGVVVLLWMPFMLFRPRDYRNALVPAWACRSLGRLLGVTMEVRGIENVNKDHGNVVVMNHQSALDLLVLAYLWPVIGNATVVSKQEVLYLPFFGVGAWLWGTLFINRSQKTNSIDSLNKESKAINERKCKVLLFPEGTRNSKDTLLPFKKGSFHIAARSGCPVQPVVISKYYFLSGSEKIFRPGHAVIHILPEIATPGTDKDTMDDFITNCRNTMQNELTKLTNDVIYQSGKKTM